MPNPIIDDIVLPVDDERATWLRDISWYETSLHEVLELALWLLQEEYCHVIAIYAGSEAPIDQPAEIFLAREEVSEREFSISGHVKGEPVYEGECTIRVVNYNSEEPYIIRTNMQYKALTWPGIFYEMYDFLLTRGNHRTCA